MYDIIDDGLAEASRLRYRYSRCRREFYLRMLHQRSPTDLQTLHLCKCFLYLRSGSCLKFPGTDCLKIESFQLFLNNRSKTKHFIIFFHKECRLIFSLDFHKVVLLFEQLRYL